MKSIAIPYGNFVKEHNKLIRALKTGSKKTQMKEASSQNTELMRMMKHLKDTSCPKNSHRMPSGSCMKNSDMKKN
jgi:glycine cleavage system protein P-like pyridoxal-binding family